MNQIAFRFVLMRRIAVVVTVVDCETKMVVVGRMEVGVGVVMVMGLIGAGAGFVVGWPETTLVVVG